MGELHLIPWQALVGGEPLRDLSATYAHKVGQAYQSEVSLLQYTVDFADEARSQILPSAELRSFIHSSL